jgi:hypothetical protein
MKTNCSRRNQQGGYALLLVMVFLGLSVLLLASTMKWTSTSAGLTDRNNEYFTSAAAAEAATEKVLVRVSRDYLRLGEGALYDNLSSYGSVVPTSTDDPYWGNYTFLNPANGSAGTYVTRLAPSSYQVLDGQYKGLSGFQAKYRIISNARNDTTANKITAGVQQDLAIQSIPLFQFAIFYTMDLEMNPSPKMIVTGRVHSNGDIYTQPTTSLVFSNAVTTSGNLYLTKKPGDPSNRGVTNPNVTFVDTNSPGVGVSTLNLPIGTNNTPDNVYEVLKTPPPGEDRQSAMGTNRFYNKADLIILVSNANNVTVTSGVALDESATKIPPSEYTNFMSIGNTFTDQRQGTTINPIDLDVAKLSTWITNNTHITKTRLQTIGKSAVNIVYVADFRSLGSSDPGVRLKNGSQLPATGLTVASPDPVYIQGDYNTKDGTGSSAGKNDTTHTAPAAVIGDAITVLSNDWKDTNSNQSISSRVVNNDTTINAAFLSGIVPTGDGHYSGGVENFPRFLEDWSKNSKTLWYNGSMVVMFNSHIADAPWPDTGTVYNPPTRKWAFDTNFYQISKLPPGTPQILFIERINWMLQAAGKIN